MSVQSKESFTHITPTPTAAPCPPTKLQQPVHGSSYSFRVGGFASSSKNYHPVCDLPDYFKVPHRADWHEDIHTSHWEKGCLLSSIWTRPVPYQAFASHSCTKLSFPKCISLPERCHWGLWDISRGLKVFLTDWPLHLFPEVTLFCPLCENTGKKYTTFSSGSSNIVICYCNIWPCRFLAHSWFMLPMKQL